MEFVFEQTPWQLLLSTLKPGDSLSAVRCLTAMEEMSEAEAEEALLTLEQGKITLCISDLPTDSGVGETALRLRQEKQLAENGQLLQGLEENDPLRIYLTELADMPACTELQRLAQRYADGEEAAAQQLTELSLGLVVERACNMTGHGVLLLDLIQEGSLGLWQGILNYQNGDFAEHIRWWIDQYLCKTVMLQAHSRGVGQKLRQGMEDYRDADQRLLSELGRNPTLEEIAEAIHVSVEEAATYEVMLEQARLRQQVQQLQEPKPDAPDEEQAVEDTAYFQLRQRISEMLSVLSEQEARLLTLRFGLENSLPQTPEQTGKLMGLTPDEVITLEAAALEKLRQQGK